MEVHIISFEVPFPADYGGVIDVYYRIEALSRLGVRIHLHCFTYFRSGDKHLEDLCASVHYYKRSRNLLKLFSKKPFMVLSRSSPSLLNRLLEDEHPIIFEGLHTTTLLNHPRLAGRVKLVRTHNIEHAYYRELSRSSTGLAKKMFLRIESKKLKVYQEVLEHADYILAIATHEAEYFDRIFGKTVCIPPFHPEPQLSFSGPSGNYAFYHGNLEIGENMEALRFLVEKVFNELEILLKVAGKGAKSALSKLSSESVKVEAIDSPTNLELEALAIGASVHVLPTFQATGFKLKLFYSLYTARHILVNPQMVLGTGLEGFCTICRSAEEFRANLLALYTKGIDERALAQRRAVIEEKLGNEKLAKELIALMG